MRVAGAATLAAVLGGCVHAPSTSSPVALDGLLAFADASRCEPAAAHEQLLGAMVAGDANDGFRPGRVTASAELLPAFGPVRVRPHDGYTTVRVPVHGTLFGLPLVEIVQSFPEGGDPGDVGYRFGAPADVVQRAVNRIGMPARSGQSVTVGPPDGYEHYIELRPDPKRASHALLTCGYG